MTILNTKVILVRHVETVGNIEHRLTGRHDYALTPHGISTINQLTNYLKDVKIDAIYSSPSERAIKTVTGLANINNLNIQCIENLSEMYFGIYDGWKWEDVNKVNPLISRMQSETNEIMCIPNQETTAEVAERMYKQIKSCAEENPGKTILIASHGVAIEAFIRKVTGDAFNTKISEYSQHNGSINILTYDSNSQKFDLLDLNDISYLK